ncbi:MAG: hypothetical protein RQ722_05135 [Desulfuromonadales bacterium]|nr:hypothetical protein [Desulfuromonadales bacterium]
MAHRTTHPSYRKLTSRLNLYTQGAPPAKLLYRVITPVNSTHKVVLLALRPKGSGC